MPIGDLETFCFEINVGPGAVCIQIPGGVELCASFPTLIPPTNDELVRQLFAQLNAAMAPLNPIFNIIDAIAQIFECAKAAATGDIEEIVKCIPLLAQKVNKLLALLPQYCVPLMIVQIIDALIVYIGGQLGQFERQREYFNRILAAELAATKPGNVALQIVTNCAKHDLDAFFQNLNAGNAPVNRLIGTINFFLHLIGVTECIPAIGAVTIDTIDPAVVAMQKLLEFLVLLRRIIPVPGPVSVSTDTDC